MKVKDLSGIYCQDYLKLAFRKGRHTQGFLQEVLSSSLLKPDSQIDLEEDEQIKKHLLSQPMPKSLNEFKNHPLYVLEKDLLKFEAIYPKDIKSFGEVRGHKIYPREAVHVLQGELNWIRMARSVKEGEEPFKVVKARPKLSIPVEERVPLFLNTFGYWQTEPYVPQKVVNGKIPRNEYGNVYMYQPDMVPEGCVHLKLNGIQNISRQLGVDAVPAVVGWEFSGGRNHPLLEGCVVLKEHEQALRDAWSEWNEIREQKKIQKTEDRMVTLWKRFVRGKILLEKMKKKYKI
uniref:Transcriptional regulator n=1 Tax=Bursaphelenchus xylophilus TaxID=6326 RepID=A0A1I7SMT0_BURXY